MNLYVVYEPRRAMRGRAIPGSGGHAGSMAAQTSKNYCGHSRFDFRPRSVLQAIVSDKFWQALIFASSDAIH